jgi:hypothetical protein
MQQLETNNPAPAPESNKLVRYLRGHHIEFSYDPIYTVILIGMAGMIAGIFLFAAGRQTYGEIVLDNKGILTTQLLNKRLSILNSDIKKWGDAKDKLIIEANKPIPGSTTKASNILVIPDSAKEILKNIQREQLDIRVTSRELALLDSGNTDTATNYFSKYIFVKRAAFQQALNQEGWVTLKDGSKIKQIPSELIDTCRSLMDYPLKMKSTLQLKINSHKSKIEFFTEYPLFALWLIFAVAQMTFWAMVIPLMIGGINNIKEKIGNDYHVDTVNLIFNCVLALIMTGIFLILFYLFLIDRPIITNDYFLQYYRQRVYVFGIMGYTTASFCFGVFVTIAKEITRLSKQAAVTLAEGDSELNKKYLALKGLFQNSFFCSGLILSLCVIWTGILVNAINNTEAFRFYFYLSGKNAIPVDFVYLLGLMNTLLLLIFYIPVKLKFDSLIITQASPSTNTTNGNNVLSGLLGSMAPLLVTISPLLASLVQNLFKLLG